MPLPLISGPFVRIVTAGQEGAALAGANAPQGRFHHDGQPALYLSSRIDWAMKALAPHMQPDDPPRVAVAMAVSDARVADTRDADLCRRLGFDPAWAAVPWQEQLAAGELPASWRAADAVRAAGADGLIYTARTAPERWHLVLFRWNVEGAALVVPGDVCPV